VTLQAEAGLSAEQSLGALADNSLVAVDVADGVAAARAGVAGDVTALFSGSATYLCADGTQCAGDGAGGFSGFEASVNTETDTLTIAAGSSRHGNTVTAFEGGTVVGPTGTGPVYVYIETDGTVSLAYDVDEVPDVGTATNIADPQTRGTVPGNGIPIATCTVKADAWVSCTDDRVVLSTMPIAAGAGITVSTEAGATIRSHKGRVESNGTSLNLSAMYSAHLVTLNNASPVAVTIPEQGGGYWWDFLNLGAGEVTIDTAGSGKFSPGTAETITLAQYEWVQVLDDGADGYHIVRYIDRAGTGLTKTCSGIACTWAVDNGVSGASGLTHQYYLPLVSGTPGVLAESGLKNPSGGVIAPVAADSTTAIRLCNQAGTTCPLTVDTVSNAVTALALVNVASSSFNVDEGTLTSIVNSTTTSTVTTVADHELTVGATVVISGVTEDTDLNGTYVVATVPTSKTFTITTSDVTDGTYDEDTTTVTSPVSPVSGYVFNNTPGALTVNLPTITSANIGVQICVRNYPTKTGAITLQAPASTYIGKDGANGSAAGTLVSAGALGDAACVVAASATQYIAYISSGAWTNN